MQENASPSPHRCLVYEGDPGEQLPVVVPLMASGLAENRRCLYLGDPAMVERTRRALASAGVDVDRESSRGALVFSSDRSYLDEGPFDPDAMIDMLRDGVRGALRDGFSGLWATGDMRWELGEDKNFERVLEYEAKLERVFRELPLAGVCQYHRHTVPPPALRAALLAHRSAYVGRTLQADNLFYVPPELLLDGLGRDGDRLTEWMWRQVERASKAELERDQTLRALADLNATLDRKVRERTADLESFAHSLSHDLRAPLRMIDGYCQEILSRQEKLDAEARASLRRVVDAAGRMRGLMDALLELNKLTNAHVDRSAVDLSALAMGVVEDLRRADPGREVEAVVAPGMSAEGDARLLALALHNLLSNAWKFTAGAARPRVEVGRTERDGKPAFFVRDNGAGFDMAYAERLFTPFSRLHPASEFPGNGLGLASVRRIIEQHSGRVWAESVPGAGAAFFFTLPATARRAS